VSPFGPKSLLSGVMDATVALIHERPTVEAAYRADADRLWRALYAWAGDAEVASDAVAEAFAQLVHRGDAVRDPSAWAWRTAFRVAAGALKQRRAADRVTAIAVDRDFGRSSLAAEPACLDRYGDPDLLAALGRLSDGQRAAVILFYYADLPVAEIASRLGSNQLAVRANLSRGRRRLRQLLGDHDG
jgi:RNA polymerase sigma factor (sigma-70 family)